MYNDYNFFGMHLIWWLIWSLLLIWIFFIPYDIPGQRAKKDSPLDILKKRLASGQITDAEYRAKKTLLEENP